MNTEFKQPPDVVSSWRFVEELGRILGVGDLVSYVSDTSDMVRSRQADAAVAIGFGMGGALLAGGMLLIHSVVGDRNLVAAVTVALMSGLGLIIGAWVARLRSLSVTDPLTGVFNRRFLALRLTRELRRARYQSSRSSLLFIDFDRLKQLNDRYGHDVGDEAIVAGAQSILSCVRSRDVVARVGGDEFNVLLANTSVIEAAQVARRIGEALAARRGPWLEPLTLSIGVAAVRERCVNNADVALYRAKQAGGDRVVAWSHAAETH